MKKFVFLCVFFAFSLSLRAQESGIRFGEKGEEKDICRLLHRMVWPVPEYVVDRVRASASGGGI